MQEEIPRIIFQSVQKLQEQSLRIFDNDDPIRFATLHSAYTTSCAIKLLMNMLPTVTLIRTTSVFLLGYSYTELP